MSVFTHTLSLPPFLARGIKRRVSRRKENFAPKNGKNTPPIKIMMRVNHPGTPIVLIQREVSEAKARKKKTWKMDVEIPKKKLLNCASTMQNISLAVSHFNERRFEL